MGPPCICRSMNSQKTIRIIQGSEVRIIPDQLVLGGSASISTFFASSFSKSEGSSNGMWSSNLPKSPVCFPVVLDIFRTNSP